MSSKLGIVVIIALIAIGGYFGYQYANQEEEPATTNNETNTNNQENTPVTEQEPVVEQDNTPAPETAVVRFETTEGAFEVTLDGKSAPQTVKNFVKLVNEGFYNGLKFHRIVNQIPGFHLIQGGDPNGDGTGGPGYTVPAEIKLKHTKGAIAMARTGDAVNPQRASSGSQFYIVLEDIAELDGQYTVFGYVSSGMNVVEKIGATPTEPGDIPLKEQVINQVTVKETK